MENLSSTAPTAIARGNDVQTLGALLDAQKVCIAAPRSVSIIGFDEQEQTPVATERPDAVAQDATEVDLKAGAPGHPFGTPARRDCTFE